MHPALGQGTEACLTVCSSPFPRGPPWVPYLESNTIVHQALCGVSGTLSQRPVDSAPRSLPHGVLVPFSTPRVGSASPLPGRLPWGPPPASLCSHSPLPQSSTPAMEQPEQPGPFLCSKPSRGPPPATPSLRRSSRFLSVGQPSRALPLPLSLTCWGPGLLSAQDPPLLCLPQGLCTFGSALCSLHLPSNILITCHFPRNALLTRTDGDGCPAPPLGASEIYGTAC